MQYSSTLQKGFTLVELLVVVAVIGILSVIGLNAFSATQRQARDARRKSDLTQIAKALELYYNDYGTYPGASNRKIAGCGASGTSVCEWGSVFEDANSVYMQKLPADVGGNTYVYKTSGDKLKFQIFARLEYTQDPVVDRNDDGTPDQYGLSCGTVNCNFAITSPNTNGSESL